MRVMNRTLGTDLWVQIRVSAGQKECPTGVKIGYGKDAHKENQTWRKLRRKEVTVQGFRNLLPALFGNGQVGSWSPISNDCSILIVEILATVESNVTGARDGLKLVLSTNLFRRSRWWEVCSGRGWKGRNTDG